MSAPTMMRAARLRAPRREGTPEDLRVEDVPTPRPGPGQVLVRVRAAGVCGSDLQLVGGQLPVGELPRTLGHEAAGEIAEVGDEVDDWQPGDRVASLVVGACGRCGYCDAGRGNLCVSRSRLGIERDGAQATYLLAEPHHLLPLPLELDFEQAAIVPCAVAAPYHALKRGGVGEEMTVAVHGLGGLGMHAVLLAKLAGAHVVGVDVDEVSLARALDRGADAVVDASDGDPVTRVREVTEGGVDRSFEFVGRPESVDEAVRFLRPGGRATVAGAGAEAIETVDVARLAADELELVGSSTATAQDVGELFDLVEDGRLDLSRSITHRWRLDELPEALSALETRAEHPVRMVVADD